MKKKVADRRKQNGSPGASAETQGKGRPGQGRLTEDQRASIAMDRFAPLRQGKGPESIKELAGRYRRDAAVISRAVTSAFRDGLVDIVRTGRPHVQRLQSLEKRILDRYPKLWDAIVVEVHSTEGNSSGQNLGRIDDETHRKLGYAMAGSTSQWRLRDADVIGFGSGRGVFYTAESAMQLPAALRVEGLHLVSLTGAVHARDHAKQLNARLDADLHVALFGMCIQHEATLHLTTHPITACDARDLTYLGKKHWAQHHPTHALVGVGVLADGHRFYEEAKSEKPDPILEKIIQPLRRLVTLCDSVRGMDPSPGYYPVADICNHLFFVDRGDLSDTIRKEILANIEEVNKRLLNVSEEQLNDVGAILLVAGSRKKAAAIHQLLDSPAFKIRMICTDSRTAEDLL
ncbi:MAG: hypothetical protein AAB403_21885 [Planctomycetota bacterium]